MERSSENPRNRLSSGGGGLRTRGVVRTRGFAPSPPPMPQRGAVRTRGAIRRGHGQTEPQPRWEMPKDLPALLNRLHEEVDGFPITVVVENLPHGEAHDFLNKVRDLLGPRDALWLLGDGENQDEGYLNLQDPRDAVFAKNLVADLLFVAASNAIELGTRLGKWKRRARAVIVAVPGGAQFTWQDVGLQDLRFVWPQANRR